MTVTPVAVGSDGTSPAFTGYVNDDPSTGAKQDTGNTALATLAGAVKAEDSASADAHPLMIVGAVRQATPANSSGTDLDYEPLNIDAGSLWAKLTSVIPGTAAANLGKAEDAAHASGDTGVMALAVQKLAPADLGADGDYAPLQISAGLLWTGQPCVTATTSITRPADTTAYSPGEAFANSTSAPTSGGFTLSSVVRASGKSCLLSDMVIVSSNPAATPLVGEIWMFDTAVTAVNDNAAFAISDAEALTVVAKVPFTLIPDTNNSVAHLVNLGCMITTVGSANIRYLVKVLNAYTPASAEVLTIRAKFMAID